MIGKEVVHVHDAGEAIDHRHTWIRNEKSGRSRNNESIKKYIRNRIDFIPVLFSNNVFSRKNANTKILNIIILKSV